MRKEIVCKNADGKKLKISHSFPYFLLSAEGMFDTRHSFTTMKGFQQDGETITGSTAEMRNIVLTIQIKGDYVKHRDELYRFFQPKEAGNLYYYENDIQRKIGYEVESIVNPESGMVRNSVISLLCPDPLFRNVDETKVSMSAWNGCIRFPAQLANPFTVTTKETTLIRDIYNETGTELGLRIRFTASGEVAKPALIDVNRHTTLVINVTMHAGDTLEINTGKSAKRADWYHNGKQENVINKIGYPPQWPMLRRGDNLFRYDAETGIEALSVDLFYVQTYWGC